MTATVWILWAVLADTKHFAWQPLFASQNLKDCRAYMTVPENQTDAHGFTIGDRWKCVRYRIAR